MSESLVKTLSKARMKEFFQALQGYGDVAAPVRATEKTHRFKIVRALEEADLSYTRTMIPPKKYFIHPEEIIFTFDKGREEPVEYEMFEARGVNAIEAPRGLLYHDYSFDGEGRVTKTNTITPTAQNAANIEKDARVIAGNLAAEDDAAIKNAAEVMVRAYDPCISCSVHLTRVK
ncbi:MAG TPA: nickel-dependent hydrogenase large subunit [Candidatus Desulfaltia sp.]|nr:nickel-dependent hydrogenase large subunit [Candidatus Desulfaltia sp.]